MKKNALPPRLSMRLALIVAAFCAGPTWAEGLMINDAYARAALPTAKAGAAFFEIVNHGDQPDRLIGARSPAAKRVELHTHIAGDDGIMRMREVEGGFPIPAGGMVRLERGGNHVMMMGLTEPFTQGKEIEVTLIFENAGERVVQIPVDLTRQATPHGGHGAGHGHSD